jgi:SAM-dependent methyltransferase
MPELADREMIREYYGETLQGSNELKTNACCSADTFPEKQKRILEQIHPEITDRFYGCGSPIPDLLEGRVILDLGCGTGRDVYIASKLAGPSGRVIGVDMTEEQLAVASRHAGYHAGKFGFERPNVEFRHGYIEDLSAAGIEDESVDVVISNCVINLSPDKSAVFSEIFRVLKPGGELFFSDVFSDRRLPARLREDPVLYGECLGGAMYLEDFRRLLAAAGIRDYREFSGTRIDIGNRELETRVGGTGFYSRTIRAFRLDSLEDVCEDYGQTATYLGAIPGYPHSFTLDDHHRFVTGKPELVCGNTADMLTETRFAPFFRVAGDRSSHFGLFACQTAAAGPSGAGAPGGACC